MTDRATMMVVAIARALRDREVVFHGLASPVPMVAVLLARKLHAPNLVYLNIAAGVDPHPVELPESTVDPRLSRGAAALFSLADVFDLAARGRVDTAFLSGVQVDRRGRLNMSVIGDYDRPKVRLPGGAGGAFLAPLVRRVLVWRTRHDPRTLVEQVDFATIRGRVERVFTPLCTFVMDRGALRVESIHPYSSPAEVRERTGFAVEVDAGTPVTPPPTAEELAALEEVDPRRVRDLEF